MEEAEEAYRLSQDCMLREMRPDSSVLVASPDETRPCCREMMDSSMRVDHWPPEEVKLRDAALGVVAGKDDLVSTWSRPSGEATAPSNMDKVDRAARSQSLGEAIATTGRADGLDPGRWCLFVVVVVFLLQPVLW